MESRMTQLMRVCAHGAFLIPRAWARSLRTRETARKPMWTSKKSRSESQTTSTLGQPATACEWALELTQARLGFFEGLLGLVALSFDSRSCLRR